MEKKATIVGTQEGFYLACVDEEREQYHCDEECGGCPHPCRILLEKDQPLEKGRHLLADIKEPLVRTPAKLIPLLIGIYVVCFIFMFIYRRYYFPHYRGYGAVVLSGFFAAAAFYLILKVVDDRRKAGQLLRRGTIIRVFPKEEG